jgi:hypothetical protein
MTPKWANTSATINRRDILNDNVGTYAAQSNHSAFGDTGFVGGVGELGAWVELGRTFLNETNNDIVVSNIANRRYYMLLMYSLTATSVVNSLFRVGSGTIDTGTNYSNRRSRNGLADLTFTNAITGIIRSNEVTQLPIFKMAVVANLSGQEKLSQSRTVVQRTAGAGTFPNREEQVAKWVNTVNPIDIFEWSGNGGNWNAGCELVILGWTPADILTTESNFWQPLGEIVLSGTSTDMLALISPKKYLWVQTYTILDVGAQMEMRFNSDTGTNYARRESFNGGADATGTSENGLILQGVTINDTQFINTFIVNNQVQEKLIISRTVRESGVGAGNAPERLEQVFKWANTLSPISAISIERTSGSGLLQSGSFVRVWGHD